MIRRLLLLLAAVPAVHAEAAAPVERIDLPTVLKLAGAQNLDVQIAEQKLNEARALESSATWQLLPTISPGIAYRGHTGRTQTVTGPVQDVDKESLSAGATVGIQLDLGEGIYRRLVAKQIAVAAGHQLEAQRQQTVLQATQAYFDLCRAQLAVGLQEEAVRIARDYRAQVAAGVQAGIAYKGDEHRAAAQLSRTEARLQQAQDALRAESTRLAQILRLPLTVPLRADAEQPSVLLFADKDIPLDQLIQQAVRKRPEIAENQALVDAAQSNLDGANYAPLFPTLGAQYFAGGLGGSTGSSRRDYASSTDTLVTLSWKIGAGGLFDSSRKHAAEAQDNQSRLRASRTRDSVVRQVIDARSSVEHLRAQIDFLKQGVLSSEAGLKLALSRRDFSVGAVLETVQSQQDVVQAKLDYLQAVEELNKAQYRLRAAVGE